MDLEFVMSQKTEPTADIEKQSIRRGSDTASQIESHNRHVVQSILKGDVSEMRKTTTQTVTSMVERIHDLEISKREDFTASDTSESLSDENHMPSQRKEKKKNSGNEPLSRDPLYKPDEENHFQLMSHVMLWTLLGVIFAWLGFLLSYLAVDSTRFVTIELPIYVDPMFEEVSEIGLFKLQLCYSSSHMNTSGCVSHELSSDEVNDAMFQISRSFASLAILLGGFMSVFLTTATFWRTINLRPVGLGLLITYFFQTLTFLFFDATLCHDRICNVSSGGRFSIAASICWFLACLATSRMDKEKTGSLQLRRRNRSRSRSHNLCKRLKKHIPQGIFDNTAGTSTHVLPRPEWLHSKARKPGSESFVIEGIQDIEALECVQRRRKSDCASDDAVDPRDKKRSKRKSDYASDDAVDPRDKSASKTRSKRSRKSSRKSKSKRKASRSFNVPGGSAPSTNTSIHSTSPLSRQSLSALREQTTINSSRGRSRSSPKRFSSSRD